MPSHELNLVHETSVDPCQVGCGMVLGRWQEMFISILMNGSLSWVHERLAKGNAGDVLFA